MAILENKKAYEIIVDLVEANASVLDVGCGTGELLEKLIDEKKVTARGVEINDEAIYQCVAKGISVVHEDIEKGLTDFSDKSFDYVLLYNTFQEVKKPDALIGESLRVGKKVIAGFPNFAYFKARLEVFFCGRVPVTASLPYEWHNTPNLHFLSLKDFRNYCDKKNIKVLKSKYLDGEKEIKILPNFFASSGIYLLSN